MAARDKNTNNSLASSRSISPTMSQESSSTMDQDDQWTVSSKRTSRKDKELTAVSKLVKKKLEDYMNKEKREIKFDPNGYYRTTKKMYKYDLAYKLLEATNMEKKKRNSNWRESSETSSSSISAITPRLHLNTCRDGITLVREAERISASANGIFQSLSVNKLAVMHGYRPDPNVVKSVETGKVQNYTRHVGAALHTDAYVQYYMKEGLAGQIHRLKSESDDEDSDHDTKDDHRRSRISKKSRNEVQHGAYNQSVPHSSKPKKTSKSSNKKQNAQNNSSCNRNSRGRCRSPTKRPRSRNGNGKNNGQDREECEEYSEGSDEENEGKDEEEKVHESNEEVEEAKEGPNKSSSSDQPKKSRKKSKSRKSKKDEKVTPRKEENEKYSDDSDHESGDDSTDSEDEFNGNSYKALRLAKRRKRPKTGYKTNRSNPKSPRNMSYENQSSQPVENSDEGNTNQEIATSPS